MSSSRVWFSAQYWYTYHLHSISNSVTAFEFMARAESKLPSGRFSIFTEAVIRRLLFPIVHWCDACLYETLNLFHWSISSALTIVYKLHFHIFTLSTFHTFCIRVCSWVCFSFVFQDDRSLWNKAAILIWSIFTTEKQATRWARRPFLYNSPFVS